MRTNTKEDLIGQLKENGLKITPQRLAIIDALVENRYEHPGATLIFNEARKKPGASASRRCMRRSRNFPKAG